MKELNLEAKLENIPQATAFVDEQLEAVDCPIKAQMQIDLAVDELFANIANYAYGDGTGSATLRFEFDEENRTAAITFIDGGVPFNPLEKDDPDVSLPAREREVGGLGIYLVKKSMDRMEYRREGDFNHFTIYKRV